MNNKIYFVLGKGGVGKTTISVLLAKFLSSQGKSTLIVECNGAQHVSEFFSQQSQGYNIQSLAPKIDAISLTPLEAIEDYVVQQLKFKKLFQIIFKNRLIQPLIEGAPGLHDAVQLGKIYDLTIQKKNGIFQWDHIIVDAPATGHGLSLLSAARTMMKVTKTGPMFQSNQLVDQVITERSEFILVTLPEELPCLETMELWKSIQSDFSTQTKLLLINQMRSLPEPLSSSAHSLFQPQFSGDFPQHSTLLQQWQEQCKEQSKWLSWLQDQNLPIPISTIPFFNDPYDAQLPFSTMEALI